MKEKEGIIIQIKFKILTKILTTCTRAIMIRLKHVRWELNQEEYYWLFVFKF